MHLIEPSPSWVFPAAEKVFSSGLPFVSCGVPSTEVADLGLDVESSTGVAFSKGSHLLDHLGDVLRELAKPVAPDLVEYLRWEVHRGELWRLLGEFLLPARALPAMLWTHCLAWTDRGVASSARGSTIMPGDPPRRIPYEGHRTVRLRFANESHRHAAVKGHVTVDTSRLRWAFPAGIAEDRPFFVKCVDDWAVVRRSWARGGFHAERIGPARVRLLGADAELCIRHANSLDSGTYPYLADKTYALWRARDTGNPRAGRPRPPGADPSHYTLIDDSGVLDVQIVKAKRLFERPGSSNYREILCDELCIYFDRHSSRVVYIATARDRFGCSDRDALCQWVAQSLLGVDLPEGGSHPTDLGHPLAYPEALLNPELGEIFGTGPVIARGQG